MVCLTAVVNGSAASSQTRQQLLGRDDPLPGREQILEQPELFRAEVQAPPGAERDPAAGSRVTSPRLSTGGSDTSGRRPMARIRATSSAKSKGLGR